MIRRERSTTPMERELPTASKPVDRTALARPAP